MPTSSGTCARTRSPSCPAFLEAAPHAADGSVDGMLAWDLFDYLDVPAGAGARRTSSSRMMRVDGALLGFFSTAPPQAVLHYTKFVVADETHAAAPRVPRVARAPARAAEPRHHPALRERSASPTRSCCRPTCGSSSSASPRTCPADPRLAPAECPRRLARPVVALLTDFGTADRLRRRHEGRGARHLPGRGARRRDARRRRRTTSSRGARARGGVLAFPAGHDLSSWSSIPAWDRRGRGVAAELGAYRFVAPDNGVLTPVFEDLGPGRVVALDESARTARPS